MLLRPKPCSCCKAVQIFWEAAMAVSQMQMLKHSRQGISTHVHTRCACVPSSADSGLQKSIGTQTPLRNLRSLLRLQVGVWRPFPGAVYPWEQTTFNSRDQEVGKTDQPKREGCGQNTFELKLIVGKQNDKPEKQLSTYLESRA